MAAIELVDFVDIYTAVAEAAKIQSTDTTNINRIKRWVNLGYLNKVVPAKRWWWLRNHTTLKISPKLTTGTVSVTQDSTAIIFSSAPATSVAGQFFTSDSNEEIYRIATHTAAATGATLDADYIGTTDAAANYQVWPYRFALPSNCKEVIEVYTDRFPVPLDNVGFQEFRRVMQEIPKREGLPQTYTVSDFDASENREMYIYPAISTERVLVQVDYIQEAPALDLDGDLPLMPVEDRSVLFLLALEKAWKYINRNTERAQETAAEAQEKLALMMGDAQDSVDLPVFRPSTRYLIRKRLPIKFRRRFSSLNFRRD